MKESARHETPLEKETKLEKDEEEVEEEKGSGVGNIQEILPTIGEKRKEQSLHMHKKRKEIKKVVIQALMEDDLEKIGDQVKEVMEGSFL